MASATIPKRKVDYPTSDGKPMAETDFHRDIMIALIQTLDYRFAARPRVYVSGNMLVYYVPGNKRKHVAPDVFVVFGVAKKKRDYYLVWEERKSPSVIVEVTSKSTRSEDINEKKVLYRDVLKVKEYILFDPFGDYLTPRLQGFRWSKGDYLPIDLIDGRLPSKALGLHFEPNGAELRLYDPKTGLWLPTPSERAEAESERAESEKQRAERAEELARHLAEELERLRQEMKQRPQ